MDVEELDSYSPSVDVIATVMMGAIVGRHVRTDVIDVFGCADFAYELADALIEKRESRLRDKKSDLGDCLVCKLEIYISESFTCACCGMDPFCKACITDHRTYCEIEESKP